MVSTLAVALTCLLLLITHLMARTFRSWDVILTGARGASFTFDEQLQPRKPRGSLHATSSSRRASTSRLAKASSAPSTSSLDKEEGLHQSSEHLHPVHSLQHEQQQQQQQQAQDNNREQESNFQQLWLGEAGLQFGKQPQQQEQQQPHLGSCQNMDQQSLQSSRDGSQKDRPRRRRKVAAQSSFSAFAFPSTASDLFGVPSSQNLPSHSPPYSPRIPTLSHRKLTAVQPQRASPRRNRTFSAEDQRSFARQALGT